MSRPTLTTHDALSLADGARGEGRWIDAVSRGPAIWATAIALAVLNIGAAMLIASAIGRTSATPPWVGIIILVAGATIATWAVLLWRDYLASVRRR